MSQIGIIVAMSESALTVRSYDNAIEAELALHFLNANGITAALADEALVETSWYLANAIQGIKLQVNPADFAEAEELLATLEKKRAEESLQQSRVTTTRPHLRVVGLDSNYDESQSGDADSYLDDDELEFRQSLSQREADARRAVRAVVFGLIIVPIQFYASWLILKVLSTEGQLRSSFRNKLIVAGLIHVVYLLWFIKYGYFILL